MLGDTSLEIFVKLETITDQTAICQLTMLRVCNTHRLLKKFLIEYKYSKEFQNFKSFEM